MKHFSMKKYIQGLLGLICISATSTSLIAQEYGAKIGVTGSFINIVEPFGNLDGGQNYQLGNYKAIGITYHKPINKRFEFESGLIYTNYKFDKEVRVNGIREFDRVESFNKGVINIPLLMRINIWKYFFINGGFIGTVDFDGKNEDINNLTGLGLALGVGLKYDFKSGASIYVNPNLNNIAITKAIADRYSIFGADIKLGFSYPLARIF